MFMSRVTYSVSPFSYDFADGTQREQKKNQD